RPAAAPSSARDAPPASPPADPALEVLLHLVEIAGERARREVLPAAVGQEGDDRAGFHLAGDTGGRHEDRAARRTGEDPLAEDELAQGRDRVAVRDEELPVEERGVEDLGHEPLVERAQPLD